MKAELSVLDMSEAIREIVRRNGGNRAAVCRTIEVARSTLNRLLLGQSVSRLVFERVNRTLLSQPSLWLLPETTDDATANDFPVEEVADGRPFEVNGTCCRCGERIHMCDCNLGGDESDSYRKILGGMSLEAWA